MMIATVNNLLIAHFWMIGFVGWRNLPVAMISDIMQYKTLPAVLAVLNTPTEESLLPWFTRDNQNSLCIEGTLVSHLFQYSPP